MRLFLFSLLALICFLPSYACGGEDSGIYGLVINRGEIDATGRRIILELEKLPEESYSTLFNRERIRISFGEEIKIPFNDLRFFDDTDIQVSDPQYADRIEICCFAPFIENQRVTFYRGHGDGIDLENNSEVKPYINSGATGTSGDGSCN